MNLGADLIVPKAPSVQPEQSQRAAPQEPGQSGFANLYAHARDAGKAPAEPSADGRHAASQSQSGQPADLPDEQTLADAGNDLPPVEDALLAEDARLEGPEPTFLEALMFGRQGGAVIATSETPEAAEEVDPLAAALTDDAPEAELATQAAATQTMATLSQPGSAVSQATQIAQAPTSAAVAAATLSNAGQEARHTSRQAEQALLADEPTVDLDVADSDPDFSQTLRASLASSAAGLTQATPETPDSPVNPLTQAMQQAAAQREAAAAAQQQPLALRQPGLSEAVVERVMWLSSQNLRSAEIQLDPAELGRLEIRISLNQEQAQVSFVSPHASVREALEGQMHRLREMFAQQGLDQLDVNVSDQSLARREGEAGQGSSVAGNGTADGELEEETVIASTPLDNGRGLVDFYA